VRPQHRLLKPEQIMLFDPKETDVLFFINRARSVAYQHGISSVLEVLPLCMRGQALQWHTSLLPDTQRRLSLDLNYWCELLEQEFKKDPLIARREARNLQFKFSTADTVSLSDYLYEKINLLRAAGVYDIESQKGEIWDGLDPSLAMLVRPIPGESVDIFRHRIREAESGAKRNWEASYRRPFSSRYRQNDDPKTTPVPRERLERLFNRFQPNSSPLQPLPQGRDYGYTRDRDPAREPPKPADRSYQAQRYQRYQRPTDRYNDSDNRSPNERGAPPAGQLNLATTDEVDLDAHDMETLAALEAEADPPAEN
jgi:hypothetical protein